MAALRHIPRENQGGRGHPRQVLVLVWVSQRSDYVQRTVDEGRLRKLLGQVHSEV